MRSAGDSAGDESWRGRRCRRLLRAGAGFPFGHGAGFPFGHEPAFDVQSTGTVRVAHSKPSPQSDHARLARTPAAAARSSSSWSRASPCGLGARRPAGEAGGDHEQRQDGRSRRFTATRVRPRAREAELARVEDPVGIEGRAWSPPARRTPRRAPRRTNRPRFSPMPWWWLNAAPAPASRRMPASHAAR